MTEPSEAVDPFLVSFLTERDHACPQCDYNLRGLQTNRCPECGEQLVLRINVAEPRQRLMLTGLAGICAGAGFNGFVILLLLILDNHMRRPELTGFGVGLGAFLLITFTWLAAWRWLRKRTLLIRLLLAAACWILALVDVLIVAATLK